MRYSRAVDLGSVLAPPYDVIDERQRAELEASDPYNVVRLILPREPSEASPTDVSGSAQHGAPDKYADAAAVFDRWLAEGVLAVDEQPALYVYQQRIDGTVAQRGLFGALEIQPLDGGVILPHENVRAGPVEDRLALMRAMRGNPEPIFLLYDGGGAASAISAAATASEPTSSATTADGITHQLWAITDTADLHAIAADLDGRTAMIADGHHRYTTYGHLRDEIRAAGRAEGPWDSGLTLLVDDSVATPDIRAIHRVIPGLSLDAAVVRVADAFRVRRLEIAPADVGGALEELADCTGPAFLIADATTFVLLVAPDAEQLRESKPADRTAAWWALDASIAAVFVMETLWGVSDSAGQVEAEHDPAAAVRLAADAGGVALLLKPAPLSGILAVARAGDAMPRKSTLFLPKPRSGMVMRSFRFEV